MLDITGGDEETVQAVTAALEERWATSGIGPVRRGSRRTGVRGGSGSTPTSCARGGSVPGWRSGLALRRKGLPSLAQGLPGAERAHSGRAWPLSSIAVSRRRVP
ncbi:DUF6207 family protein [Streptomyces sp. NBC_01343]|uniref:DUF6207 family protein n=1 Tax=Streptomyces sp. NBC_01343 TaxID=2903832 RepID=UPI002E15A951|nr:DUF6207 family protein [Streptomyces sp. NBC_01343]